MANPSPIRPRKSRAAARAAEPSSWAGLAGLVATLAPALPPTWQAVAGAVGAVAGAVAMFKADPGARNDP